MMSYGRRNPGAVIWSVVIILSIIYVALNPSFLNLGSRSFSSEPDASCCARCPKPEIVLDDKCMKNFKGAKASGGSYRQATLADMPPETQPGWDPTQPETPTPRFPKALILGFAKCGTAALVAFLPLHPDIVTIDWEIDYFCDRMYYFYDLHWYRMRMPPSTSNQITMEKSPCYLKEPESIKRMYAFNNTLKVMLTVRHPVTRTLSRYAQEEATNAVFGVQPRTLEQYIMNKDGTLNQKVLENWAVYSEIVEQVYSVFPTEQIHIIDGDLLITNPLQELARIETFLGIQHYFSDQDVYFDTAKGFYCYRIRATGEKNCLGSSKGRKHIEISDKLNNTLKTFFKPYNEKFYKIIGRRFNWD